MTNPFSGFDVCFDPIRSDEINDAEYDLAEKRMKYAFSEWCIALFERDATPTTIRRRFLNSTRAQQKSSASAGPLMTFLCKK
ncbi:hypothetical protein [Burkholderia sp. L27(2015)]|uniref:hypothetical protein n=1 Tax=Burkholderia sp. L27(2015) TaxID=1641858 RepID=UPI001576FE83|nr:hypothetical protein [Burkholderia sp. L27(2015)]